MADELTPRQQLFVREYLVDLNATQAAIRCGYSRKTAQEQSARLLSKVMIQKAITDAQSARVKRLDITADRVVQEIAKIAFADLGHFVKWGPDGVIFVDSESLDTAAVSEVSETNGANSQSRRIKLHDKLAALEKLMKHLGLYPKEGAAVELRIADGVLSPDQVRRMAQEVVMRDEL